MIDFNVKKKSKDLKKFPLNVPLEATVTAVEWAKGFVEGSAYEVFYDIKDQEGRRFKYKELFFNESYNERTSMFENFLHENEIESLSDFVGCRVQVTFLKQVKNNRAYTNIVDRILVSTPKGAFDVGTEN